MDKRSKLGEESVTGEYTEIISFLFLCQNVGAFVAGNELAYPYYHLHFLNSGLAFLVLKPL